MATLLCMDVGATSTKWSLLHHDSGGLVRGGRRKTAYPGSPLNISRTLLSRIAITNPDYVVIGFPGETRSGVVIDGANLPRMLPQGELVPELVAAWKSFDLESHLELESSKPIGVINDAELFLRGAMRGEGLEIAITLGTGCGFAGAQDGEVLSLPDVGHRDLFSGHTYDAVLGESARRVDEQMWQRHVLDAIRSLCEEYQPDIVHLGGGNAGRLPGEVIGSMETTTVRYRHDVVSLGALQYFRERWGSQ